MVSAVLLRSQSHPGLPSSPDANPTSGYAPASRSSGMQFGERRSPYLRRGVFDEEEHV